MSVCVTPKVQKSYTQRAMCSMCVCLCSPSGPPELYSERSVFTGPPGGQVQVRCLYRGRLISSEKKWCRSGTSVCLTAGRSSRLHKYTLTFDPQTGVLSVTIRHLSPKDGGWYWCTGGDTQLPVYVSVSQETHTLPVTRREFE